VAAEVAREHFAYAWVLTLNSGIRFQDGKPLNAAALIACMQYQLKQNSSATAALPGARPAGLWGGRGVPVS
jgi:hypothetical protein